LENCKKTDRKGGFLKKEESTDFKKPPGKYVNEGCAVQSSKMQAEYEGGKRSPRGKKKSQGKRGRILRKGEKKVGGDGCKEGFPARRGSRSKIREEI